MGLLSIIYRDDHLVAINKPDALLVHRSRQARDHVFALQLVRDQIGRFVYPVHRLDRATSGVLLFALSSETAATLVESFTQRTITKRYLAVVRGYTDPSGTIDHALAESKEDPLKEAVTHYTRLATAEIPEAIAPYDSTRLSLVEAFPQTGRMHQIRKHFKHISHPIFGDTTYGKGPYNQLMRDHFHLHRLLLHAHTLTLPHPVTKEPLTLTAPVPPEFQPLFETLNWSDHL